jgi:hypothetical protein
MEPIEFDNKRIIPKPCNQDDALEHLSAFARSFIVPKYRERWHHILVERPKKAWFELIKFPSHRDERYCIPVKSASEFLRGRTKEQTGIYFDGYDEPFRLTIMEADLVGSRLGQDAIFSIDAGQLAVFFFHESELWGCQRK